MTGDNFACVVDAEIVSTYRSAASTHGQYSLAGDHEEANSRAEVLAAAYRELRSRGSESQRLLLQLLDDEDPNVRTWAGAHALEFAPEVGEAALEDLAEGDSPAAFAARVTLREWRLGRLAFP
jgi:hypothetical protein